MMELIAPCGQIATSRRVYMRRHPERNKALPSHSSERNKPLPNSFITLRVQEIFAADRALSNTRIVVETFEGIVQLSGIVRWQYELSWAKRVAWRIGGVRGIRSCIRLARTARMFEFPSAVEA